MYVCLPLLLQGWNEAHPDSGVSERYKLETNASNTHKNNNVSKASAASAYSAMPSANDTCQASGTFLSYPRMLLFVWNWIGPFFCALCLVEAVVRAVEARQLALENEALDNFERKLARLYSVTRCSVMRQQPSREDYHQQQVDTVLARNTLRLWTPVLSVLSIWFVLLPWPDLMRGDYATTCGTETSLATLWITYSLMHMSDAFTALQTKLWQTLLEWVIPLDLYFHPKRFYQRMRQVVRWIRYLRFAGPLIRILLKLNDQFLVFVRTRSQIWLIQIEKAKRLASRSMLFDDIQRIESLAKMQTRLASVPSQMMHLAQEQAAGVGQLLAQRKEQGRKLRRKLERLKQIVRHSSSKKHSSSELYDRIVDLAQEIKTTIGDTVFTKHLISPQTRFSVGWRMIVTCALLTELCRLYVSYQLSRTFQISITDMIRSLLSDCDEEMRERFRRMSSENGTIRILLRNLLRLPMRSGKKMAQKCLTSNPLSNLLLTLGQITEYTIDIVCFIDIFVWFFTGELDADGVVVPKPFFTRCILPGTMIQVLDHPTLPDRLPKLIKYSMNAARTVGYSRVIRWMLAIVPAIDMLLVDPIRIFLFRPMDDDEWMRYTESIAIFPAMSGADIRNAFQSSTNLARMRRKSISSAMNKRMEQSPSIMFFPLETSESSDVRAGLHLDDLSERYGQKHNSLRRGSLLDESGNFSYGLMVY